jgi:hypothetical protein
MSSRGQICRIEGAADRAVIARRQIDFCDGLSFGIDFDGAHLIVSWRLD